MSFLLVFVGFLTIRRIRSLGAKYITGAVLSSAAFLILFEKFGSGNEGYIQIGTTLLFLIIQGAALHTVSNIRSGKSEFYCETLLTVTMMIEMFAASLTTIGLVAYHEGFSSYAPFGKNKDSVTYYAMQVEGTEGHMNFERSELFPNNVCDLQSLYDVKGLSIFSSTTRESFVKYMRNYGFHNNGINGLRNAGITRVTATLLNARNMIEIDKTQAVPALFEQEYKDGIITAWGNPDALSVGFMTDPAVIDYAPDYDKNLDVFDKTNGWVNSMGAPDVYKPVVITTNSSSGLSTTDKHDDVIVYSAAGSAPNDGYSFSITVDDADMGADIYIYANAKKGGNVTITNNGSVQKFEIRSYQIICLGTYQGTPIELTVKYSENPGSSVFVYGYQLDRAGYDKMLEILGDEQLEVTAYDSTSLSGHIDVKEDGLLFLSIPYAEGWSAVVDGEQAEVVSIQDALMGIRLGSGSHDITIRYTPAGFKEGLLISAVSVFAIALMFVIPAITGKAKKNKETVAAAGVSDAAAEMDKSEEVIEEVPVTEIIEQTEEASEQNDNSEEQSEPEDKDD